MVTANTNLPISRSWIGQELNQPLDCVGVPVCSGQVERSVTLQVVAILVS